MLKQTPSIIELDLALSRAKRASKLTSRSLLQHIEDELNKLGFILTDDVISKLRSMGARV